MDVLKKFTVKDLKLNKKRTLVTIIGIMLSVALITTVATMYQSLVDSLISYEINSDGNYHVYFSDISTENAEKIVNNRNVEKASYIDNIGYAKLEDSENEYKPYAYIIGYSDEALDNLAVNLKEGRLPENDSEIIIPSHLKTSGRIKLSVGDTITLDVGKRVNEFGEELNQLCPYLDEEPEKIVDTTRKTYTVVGIANRPTNDIEDYSAPGFTFITYMNKNDMTGKVSVFVRLNKKAVKKCYEVTADMLGFDAKIFDKYINGEFESEEEWQEIYDAVKQIDFNYGFNYYLIMIESKPYNLGGSSNEMIIAAMIVCLIIIFTSVFCIKNSFDISITEKIREYGMLRSIGATKKQIRKNVMFEALILGTIGIPLGVLLGELASWILVFVSNTLLGENVFDNGVLLIFSPSWIAIIFSVLLGTITIYLSAFRSAKKASKVSPIVSIRNSGEIKIKSKKLGVPKLVSKLFGMGGTLSYKNLKRNKKKYRTTIISIAVSVMTFIALSSFMKMAFGVVKHEIDLSDYDLAVTVDFEEIKDKDKDIDEVYDTVIESSSWDDVDEYGIYKYAGFISNNLHYSEKYIQEYYRGYTYEETYVDVLVPDDVTYKKYIDKLGLKYDEIKDKGILVDNIKAYTYDEEGNENKIRFRAYSAKKGDKVSGKINGVESEIEVGYLADDFPFGTNEYSSYIILSNEFFDGTGANIDQIWAYYTSEKSDKVQDNLDVIFKDADYNVYIKNNAENARQTKKLFLLIAIFLYGFIIVITLIGITNIFNTITTNMQLRRKEFAMLKSVGMTSNEFNRMIRLETIFMGSKSLFYGLPIGMVFSYLIYLKLGKPEGLPFAFPYMAVLIAVLAVFLLITGIMKYSMSKIKRQNTIETIRNDNV